jgi:hypothetical protein
MPRHRTILLAVATLSGAVALAAAQSPDPAGPPSASPDQQYTQSQPAPIERSDRSWSGPVVPQAPTPQASSANAQVIPGVILRVGRNSNVTEVAKTPERVELRVTRGVANLNVHDPAKETLILVDLPGGQTQVLKNGVYTFNADTNTARVLKGEAQAFPGDIASNKDEKPVKIKEDHKVVFDSDRVRSEQFMPEEAHADLVPGSGGARALARSEGYGAYSYGPYGDGFYGYPYSYPYYAYGYPWGWEPYGYYPFGVGIGFGYYGGFHGGGFHGGGFHGHR